MTRVAFLGPEGTITGEAVGALSELADAERVPCSTIPAVVACVEAGDADVGLVPIENSIEGTVTRTVDLLAFETDLFVTREVVQPVDLNLLGHPGGEIREVLSHPHALAQCRAKIAEIAPEAELVATTSTAQAARDVAEDAVGAGRVAIASKYAASLYGLDVLDEDITDYEGGATRFVLLGREIPAITGADKTSILAFLAQDRPGSLLGILQELAVRGLNLTKLESRPMKGELGDYFFVIDIEGHISDALLADALRGLRYRMHDIKFCGSYPRATRYGLFDEQEEEAAWADAGRWVDALLDRVTDGDPQ